MVRYKSEDILLTFTLNDNGSPLNLNNYPGIIVIIYDKEQQIQAKYSKQVLSDFNNSDFIDTNPISGTFQIKCQAEDTATWSTNEQFAEIKTQISASGWSNNSFHTIVKDIFLFELKDSFSVNYLSLSGSV